MRQVIASILIRENEMFVIFISSLATQYASRIRPYPMGMAEFCVGYTVKLKIVYIYGTLI